MARKQTRTYAISAGLTAGAGLALPVVAFAATLPFEGPHAVVSAAAVPFAVGSLAGAGIFALAARAIDSHAERVEEEAAEERRGWGHHADNVAANGLFGRHNAAPKGVPIIARAQGAPSEEEAWAEIDALLSDDSPISCDPATSKDIYQIAFEELRREAERTAQTAATPVPAASATTTVAEDAAPTASTTAGTAREAYRAAAVHVKPASTAEYLALAGASAPAASERAVATAAPAASVATVTPTLSAVAAAPATPVASAGAYQAPARAQAAAADGVDNEFEAARQAALASLDIPVGARSASDAIRAAAQTRAEAAPNPIRPSLSGSLGITGAGARPAESAASVSAGASEDVPETVPTVPMADYSGHEDMWAQALAVLAEEPAPRHDAGYIAGKHARQLHDHVNALIEEEFDRSRSQSAKSTSREFLRVIQGGTASMRRLQAEA